MSSIIPDRKAGLVLAVVQAGGIAGRLFCGALSGSMVSARAVQFVMFAGIVVVPPGFGALVAFAGSYAVVFLALAVVAMGFLPAEVAPALYP